MGRKAGPTPDQVWMAELLANAGVKLQAEQERQSRCCARCMRGTKALQGPCGYGGKCPKNCHTKGTP